MEYKKIIEEYQAIQKVYEECESSEEKQYQQLIQKIEESLKEKSQEELSKEFSYLFDIWLIANASESLEDEIYNEGLFNNGLNEKPVSETQKIQFEIQKEKVVKFLDFKTISQTDTLLGSQKIIEYILNILWLKIFKQTLTELAIDESYTTNFATIEKYFHQNWPLYELINQINTTINQMSQHGTSREIKISDLTESEKNEVLENTDEICRNILETYILDIKKNKTSARKWFPLFTTYRETKLNYILATSELVSYMFEYELMSTKDKKIHREKVQKNIYNIYNNLIYDNILYTAIESYINTYDKKDIIVKYKNHLFSPRTILVFTIAIIQEIIKKSLSQSRKNIFFTINGKYRDKGLTEKEIISKIKRDKEKYMLIYHYLDKPGS